jgi:hypothetical protein
MTEGFGMLYKKKLHYFYAYSILVGLHHGKRLFGRQRNRRMTLRLILGREVVRMGDGGNSIRLCPTVGFGIARVKRIFTISFTITSFRPYNLLLASVS